MSSFAFLRPRPGRLRWCRCCPPPRIDVVNFCTDSIARVNDRVNVDELGRFANVVDVEVEDEKSDSVSRYCK